ncbi:MAG: hypothetical protein AMXMBFR33_20010 [Candidatus Xenobia bacterium]
MESLAEALDVSKQSVKDWEAERRRPSIENIRGLNHLLGLPSSVFMGLAGRHSVPARENPPPVEGLTDQLLTELLLEMRSMRQEMQALTQGLRQVERAVGHRGERHNAAEYWS